MGVTPDRAPGPSLEEELQLEDRTTDGDPTVVGALRFVGDDFVGRTSAGVVSLTTGSGLSEGAHEALDTLVHGLAEERETVVTRVAGRVTEVLDRTTDPSPLAIRKVEITRSGGLVSQIVDRQYDVAGAEVTAKRMTGAVNRSGGRVSSIDWTKGS